MNHQLHQAWTSLCPTDNATTNHSKNRGNQNPKPKKIRRVEGGGASTRVRALYTFRWGQEKSRFGLAATTHGRGQIKKGERESKGEMEDGRTKLGLERG